jgi:hypothetical protein
MQRPQPEQSQMPYYPQVAMEPTQGEIKPSSQWHQMDGFAQCQMTSSPQFDVEQHDYPQAPSGWGVLGVYGEQPVDPQMGTVAAGCMTDPPNLKSEAMDASEMFKYVNLDGYDV